MKDYENTIRTTEELSPAAVKWLTDHKMLNKAKRIEEYPDCITFFVQKDTGLVEVHTVQLSKGSWSFMEMHKRDLYR